MSMAGLDFNHLRSVALARLAPNGVLLEANAGFLRLLASPDQAVADDPVGSCIASAFIQPDFRTLARTAREAEGYQGLMTIGQYDGKTRTLIGRVVENENGLSILAEHDIEEAERIDASLFALNSDYAKAQHELTQVNLALQQLKKELEERVAERTRDLKDALTRTESANKAKDAFLATMNHELRTPLNSILGFSDILYIELADSPLLEYVAEIRKAGRHLTRLINDILLVSRLKAEQMGLEFSDFELASMLDDVKTGIADRANAKKQTVSVQVDSALPKHMHGDQKRLSQALTHLLDNAVKFSGPGTIMLRASSAWQSSTRSAIRFEVEDKGIGIDLDKQSEIFDSFKQIDDSLARAYGGTGLGLAICKQLVLLMGGNIGLNSTPGSGSLFWIEIPIEAAESHQPAAPHMPELQP